MGRSDRQESGDCPFLPSIAGRYDEMGEGFSAHPLAVCDAVRLAQGLGKGQGAAAAL